MRKFKIDLTKLHNRTDMTSYMVAMQIKKSGEGISHSTVRKYTTEVVYSETVPKTVALIAEVYGVELWDVVELVEVGEQDPPEIKTPVAAA